MQKKDKIFGRPVKDENLMNSRIPPDAWCTVRDYVERGIHPGDFLYAVLSNDLKTACVKADERNKYIIWDYVYFFWNCAPIGIWGSPENVDKWMLECQERREAPNPRVSENAVQLPILPSDMGRWVVYTPANGQPKIGRVKSSTDKWVFVVYKCDDDWENFMEYTGEATDPDDLYWITDAVEWGIRMTGGKNGNRS